MRCVRNLPRVCHKTQCSISKYTAMKKSLFYTITNLISGGNKKQQIRAGVDYIKVNYLTDNYQLVDKVIDIVAPASDADQTVREQLYLQRSTVFTVES